MPPLDVAAMAVVSPFALSRCATAAESAAAASWLLDGVVVAVAIGPDTVFVPLPGAVTFCMSRARA